jgi:hypothetical protein
VQQNYLQLLNQIKKLGYQINQDKATPEIICRAMATGFPDKIFENIGRGWYRNTTTGEEALLGRESCVSGNLIIANELITIQTRRGGELPLITLATKLEPTWLNN